MSAQHPREELHKEAFKLTAKFLRDLADLLDNGGEIQDLGHAVGRCAKHKSKEAEKAEVKIAKSAIQSQHAVPIRASSTPAEKLTALSQTASAKAKEEKKQLKKKHDAAADQGLKKPLSDYMLYCISRRPFYSQSNEGKSSFIVKDLCQGMRLCDVTKLIGEEWRKMPDDQKKIWRDKSIQMRLDYQIKTYNLNNSNNNSGATDVSTKNANASAAIKPKQDSTISKKESVTKTVTSKGSEGAPSKQASGFAQLQPTQTLDDYSSSMSSLSESDEKDNVMEEISSIMIREQSKKSQSVVEVPKESSDSDLL